MTTIFCSDIHGSYNAFKNKIETMINKYPNAEIVLGGDYIDGYGEIDVLSTLKYIRQLQKEYNTHVLIGNHEDMLLRFYYQDDVTWYLNGAKKTIKSLFGRGFSKERTKHHLSQLVIDDVKLISWLKSFSVDYLNDDGYFVHAFTAPTVDIDTSRDLTPYDDKIWNRMLMDVSTNNTEKTIIVGHTPIQIISNDENAKLKPIEKETNDYPIYFCDGGASHFSEPLICVFEKDELIDYL